MNNEKGKYVFIKLHQ